MIKILVVVNSLSRGSGISTVALNYFNNISRKDFHMDFLYFQKTPDCLSKEVEAQGSKCLFITKPGLRSYKRSAQDLESFFSEHGQEYDIVHCHVIILSRMVFGIARKYGNPFCISHIHNSKFSENLLKSVRNRIVCRGLLRHSDHIFTCSDYAAEKILGRSGAKSGKCSLLPNAMQLAQYSYSEPQRESIRQQLNLAPDTTVLGHVGRLSRQKNHKFLFKVFRRWLSCNNDGVLLLIGDGELKSRLVRLAEKLKIADKVMFLGTRADIGALLSAMDVFVFPSLFEGLGIVLVEAQASGLPCIASSNVPDAVDVTGQTQFLRTRRRDIDSWVGAIERALHGGRKAGFTGEEYAIELQAAQLGDFYRKSADGAKKTRQSAGDAKKTVKDMSTS